jgi:hypothetical protein
MSGSSPLGPFRPPPARRRFSASDIYLALMLSLPLALALLRLCL